MTNAQKSATVLMTRLSATKLDKHGNRLMKAAKAIVDGGDADVTALKVQVDSYLTNGAPEETKSTRRRTGPVKDAVALTPADKAQVADEAKSRRSPDYITAVQNTRSGPPHLVVSAGGKDLLIPQNRAGGEVSKLAVIGGSMRAVQAAFEANKPTATMARGVDSHNSPQTAKAVADSKAATKPAPKAAPAKAEKKAARKEERAAKASPKADDSRKITVVKKDFAFGREGSARRASWDACLKAGNVAAYAKAGGALKYLTRWVSAGAIKLG